MQERWLKRARKVRFFEIEKWKSDGSRVPARYDFLNVKNARGIAQESQEGKIF